MVSNCGLRKMWCRPIGQLSKGYRQRVGLAQALVHDPQVLILDEPTSGLDPLQIIEIRELIRRLSHEKAILFSTHIIQEIAAVSDRMVIINEGRIRADGKIDELAARVQHQDTIRFSVQGGEDISERIRGMPGVKTVETGPASGRDASYLVATDTPELTERALGELARELGLAVVELHPVKPDLEKVFTTLVHGKA